MLTQPNQLSWRWIDLGLSLAKYSKAEFVQWCVFQQCACASHHCILGYLIFPVVFFSVVIFFFVVVFIYEVVFIFEFFIIVKVVIINIIFDVLFFFEMVFILRLSSSLRSNAFFRLFSTVLFFFEAIFRNLNVAQLSQAKVDRLYLLYWHFLTFPKYQQQKGG